MSWLPVAVYVVAYDVLAKRQGKPTLSADCRTLDERPWLRYTAAAAGLFVWAHLFGPRRWPFTPWGRRPR